jgi:hypothetical protein
LPGRSLSVPKSRRTGSERCQASSSPVMTMMTPAKRCSIRTEQHFRRYLHNTGRTPSLCLCQASLTGQTCSFSLRYPMPNNLKPGGEFKKDVKIVGTNPTSRLESIKLAKNEPKTNCQRSGKLCSDNAKLVKQSHEASIGENTGTPPRLSTLDFSTPQNERTNRECL